MATRENAIPVNDQGQFDDAEQDFTVADVPILAWTVPVAPAPVVSSALDAAPPFDPRQGRQLIDDAAERDLFAWSSSSDTEEADEDDEDDLSDDIQVDDEDWEISERDFTKQYNRLKQHIAVRTGKDDAPGMAPSLTNASTRVPLPAINMPSSRNKSSAPSDALPAKSHARTTDQLQALAKYTSRLAKIAEPYTLGAGVNRKGPSATANMKDKSDRATNEQVLDPRTRLILFKMIGRGLVHEVNGCVSTGKEANVYHALTPEKTHLALKIYKTSILTFKDRDRYVSGEYRFRRGYSRHNPRKMVRVWAEKEMRNLKRLVAAGLRCPEPIEVRENVLVMRFLGDADGWAAPRLKDAVLPPEDVDRLYRSMLLATRTMFHACKLVHADLSEYNVLYHERELWIIDVSQSVEHDHPSAFDFLRKDLANVDEFFARAGARRTLGLKRSFDFVTKEDEDPEALLERMLAEERTEDDDDAAFKEAYIPRSLNQVYDPERDVEKLNRGQGESLIYNTTIGVEPAKQQQREGDPDHDQEHEDKQEPKKPKPARATVHFEDGRDASGDELDDASDSGGEDEEGESKEPGFEDRKPRGHRHEDRDAKRDRKRAVKEEAREKRKNKMPKAEKKKRVNATKAGR
ncbi:RIO1-domain-containing protein [Exidia glandulosa HHB12029]|uniref:Serine/threonine-protein kinase RIO1 n=1 Tax=Exidia glandulosa HHB12029 TaxID=1314781 RepID=A0A165FFV6_EXIGL|nr:RIO1-domain-containing protein [Exidia glandulosa HHB12029]